MLAGEILHYSFTLTGSQRPSFVLFPECRVLIDFNRSYPCTLQTRRVQLPIPRLHVAQAMASPISHCSSPTVPPAQSISNLFSTPPTTRANLSSPPLLCHLNRRRRRREYHCVNRRASTRTRTRTRARHTTAVSRSKTKLRHRKVCQEAGPFTSVLHHQEVQLIHA